MNRSHKTEGLSFLFMLIYETREDIVKNSLLLPSINNITKKWKQEQ